jgi:23S rRNA (uridine2552-2'-O)-methyltransferase
MSTDRSSRDLRLGRAAGSKTIRDDPDIFSGTEAIADTRAAVAGEEADSEDPPAAARNVWLDSDDEDDDEVLSTQRRRAQQFAQAEAGAASSNTHTSMQSRTAGRAGRAVGGSSHLGRGVSAAGLPAVAAASLNASLADELLGATSRSVGRVVAVDLLPVQGIWGAGFVQGDFDDASVRRAIRGLLPGGQADVILSDMAHHFLGDGDTDTVLQTQLARQAAHFACGTRASDPVSHSHHDLDDRATMSLARPVLKRGGHLVLKLRGVGDPAVSALIKALGTLFGRCVIDKPDASRAGSAEVFAVCLGYRGRRLEPYDML